MSDAPCTDLGCLNGVLRFKFIGRFKRKAFESFDHCVVTGNTLVCERSPAENGPERAQYTARLVGKSTLLLLLMQFILLLLRGVDFLEFAN